MSPVGQLEKLTQARVVKLFRETLGYDDLGSGPAAGESIDPALLASWLKKQGVDDALITRALHLFDKAAGDMGKSLYDRNRAVYDRILTIAPEAERARYDVGLPMLTPALVRKRSLADDIAALDVDTLEFPVIPLEKGDAASRKFKYEGFDVITLAKEIERDYTIPEPQTAQEVIGYYARRIAEQVKLPTSFAAIVPKLREFFEWRAFGRSVSVDDRAIVKAMATPLCHFITVKTFVKALAKVAIAEQEPDLIEADRMLSTCAPYPWSQAVEKATRTVFNLVACQSPFEAEFARFVDSANDVAQFAKIPMQFGFYIEYLDPERNLRLYYPDWVVRDKDGNPWLIETKGLQTAELLHKDEAASRWCEAAKALTGRPWRYLRVNEKEYYQLGPARLKDLLGLWK